MDGGEVLEVLRQIRDEAKQTNVRLESLAGRVEFLEQRTAKGFEELTSHLDYHLEKIDLLAQRQPEGELRLASEVVALAQVTRDFRDIVLRRIDDHIVVVDHEKRIQSLESRIADGPGEP